MSVPSASHLSLTYNFTNPTRGEDVDVRRAGKLGSKNVNFFVIVRYVPAIASKISVGLRQPRAPFAAP